MTFRAIVWGVLLLCCTLHVVRAGTEIFRNAGFEAPLGPDNWYCAGCTGEQYGHDKVEGTVSMRASQRRGAWSGPAYDLAYGSDVISDRMYDFQINVQLMSGGDVKHRVIVTIRTEFSDGETLHRQIATLSAVSQTDGWQRIADTWTVPVYDKPVTSMRLYVEGPPHEIDLLVDRSSLTEAGVAIVDTLAGGAELLSNPGFESSLDSWLCRSCSGVQYTTDCHGGASCMMVQERGASWAGPSQNLAWGSTVKGGHNYRFSIWVKFMDGGDTSYQISAKLHLTFSGWTSDVYSMVAKNWISAGDGWKLLAGDYTIPDYGDTVSSIRVYLTDLPAEIRFLVDDASLKEFVSPTTDWKSEADARIEQIRKRDVKLRINTPNAQGISVEIAQTRSHFAFGSVVSALSMPSNSLYNDLFFDNFEWAVLANHLKWRQNERNEGVLTFDRADAAIALLESRGIPIRGHNVFWGAGFHVPAWLPAYSGLELEQKCWKRVDDVVGRYAGRLQHWDVNNEMLHGNFFVEKTGNPQIRYEMFQKVKEKDPGAKLFLNDYGVINSGAMTQAYVQQVQEFLANGAPVDALGAQGHLKSRPDPVVLKSRLDLLATAGLPIWVTELTVAEPDEMERAAGYEDALRVAFSHPAVEGIMLWAYWGGGQKGDPQTAIFNIGTYEMNEAGRRWQQLVLADWRTNLSLHHGTTTSAGQEFDFRGFHGNYEVTVKFHGQVATTKTFYLSPGDGTRTVDIDMPNDVIVG